GGRVMGTALRQLATLKDVLAVRLVTAAVVAVAFIACAAWLSGWPRGVRKENLYRGLSVKAWMGVLENWEVGSIYELDPPKYVWQQKSFSPSVLERLLFKSREDRPSPRWLMQGDPDAIPVLIELLKCRYDTIREVATQGLQEIGEPDRVVVPT